ncbi:hypothetical protein BASA81_003020 [Batrachochytrium salamandrivorans]|nr:hypothetical protein BASA81_003020 [Batrachochytrium salamandrivorans]
MSISLRALLQECGNLGRQAGEILRQVHLARLSGKSLDVVDKSEGGHFDPQTVADRRAEAAICLGLRSAFGPDLCIVGEEGGSSFNEHNSSEEEERIAGWELDWWEGEDIELDCSRVTVFIDPLDATREYTQGHVEFCTVLIGICLDSVSVAGVMVEPFNNDSGGTCWWGAVGKGCFQTSHGQSTRVQLGKSSPQATTVRLVVSKSRAGGAVEHFVTRYTDLLDLQQVNHSIQFAGGCGYKILQILKNEADLYPFPCPGTSSWDSCAGSALLQAAGGALLGLQGKPLSYSSSGGFKVDGLVAGRSPELVSHATLQIASGLLQFRSAAKFDFYTNASLSAALGCQVLGFETSLTGSVWLGKEFCQLPVYAYLANNQSRTVTYTRSGNPQHVKFFTTLLPGLVDLFPSLMLLHQEVDSTKQAIVCFLTGSLTTTLEEQIRFLIKLHTAKLVRGCWLRSPNALDDYFGQVSSTQMVNPLVDFAYLFSISHHKDEVVALLQTLIPDWNDELFQREVSRLSPPTEMHKHARGMQSNM